jgi:hypothetical protein
MKLYNWLTTERYGINPEQSAESLNQFKVQEALLSDVLLMHLHRFKSYLHPTPLTFLNRCIYHNTIVV